MASPQIDVERVTVCECCLVAIWLGMLVVAEGIDRVASWVRR